MSLTRDQWQRIQRVLRRTTAWPTLVVLACDLLILGLAAYLQSTWLALLGFLQVYLIHHECAHHAVFEQVRANERLGHVLGFIILYPFQARRRAHVAHHTWTNHRARDPATARALARIAAMTPGQLRRLDWMWRCCFPIFTLSERISLCKEFVRDPAERTRVIAYGVGYLALGTLAYRQGWLLSFVLAFYLLHVVEEALNLPHHVQLPLVDDTLPVWEQDTVSHSLRSLPVWSPWLLLHFNLHAAHHVFPHQPWYRLPELDRLLQREHVRDTELSWTLRERLRPQREVFKQFFPATRALER